MTRPVVTLVGQMIEGAVSDMITHFRSLVAMGVLVLASGCGGPPKDAIAACHRFHDANHELSTGTMTLDKGFRAEMVVIRTYAQTSTEAVAPEIRTAVERMLAGIDEDGDDATTFLSGFTAIVETCTRLGVPSPSTATQGGR
jgi:hypothetical protein